MKLYATVTNDNGKKEGKGGDKWLEIELTHGNNPVGTIILDDYGGQDWKLSYQRPGGQSWTIDSCITPTGIRNGSERQKQNDTCTHDWDNYGKCCDCKKWRTE